MSVVGERPVDVDVHVDHVDDVDDADVHVDDVDDVDACLLVTARIKESRKKKKKNENPHQKKTRFLPGHK